MILQAHQCFRVLSALFLFLAIALKPALAEQPRDGFFTGIDLIPLSKSPVSELESEPAVVLMFALDQNTADVTRQFEEWYAGSIKSEVSVYAIAVAPSTLSMDLIKEAVQQRGLSMPVYLARVDMLLGDDFRLMVVNNDAEVKRFNTLDFSSVGTALAGLGVSAIQAVTSGSLSEIITSQTVTTDTGTLPDGSTYSTVTTSTERRSRIAGGTSGESVYRNDDYGFQVQFPPAWRFRIAARNDGAVAVDRPGSKMDMRTWIVDSSGIETPQEYIDQRLNALARDIPTRVNVERRIPVRSRGVEGVDIIYNYTKPIDPRQPAMGVLLYRGRMQIFVRDSQVVVASIDAPAGEFTAMVPIVESFFHSFKLINQDSSSSHITPGTI